MLRMNTQTSKKSKNMSWIKPLATIAAVFVLLFVGLTSYLNMAIDSIISFDINPSIELMVNRKEKVIRVKALNEDGEKVIRSEEHTSELQSRPHLVCRLLLEKKKKKI